ncbi:MULTISPECIES: RsmB/NOP family class I SAM-dependent RNA methyltransferase [unclassified Beijerinckia]|uniref:RsmB/NOP family class I SAM-dependent RNA methyltransferase n=1 Tax=unclassified Beijerinckia TaxID=2638183 RepID=UPI0008989AAA|nr:MULTISPECIES: RsmB/NOP family class I SAM-dependent RNA methyltransferase [unclassified Beijerinckia]MDH7794884.1 16S rRNA (cytosine967-C5)-methyltransferase [Beijerinckia sp. GAS462]SEB79201.1 16S rRNA (cytosine967-C5)-methyltransferase [Beijerinckia sp. 28-YEA-48]
MTPAARIAAAIEILEDIETRRRPAGDALKDWGLRHRFAGSKDRSGIASLVYDALRVRASAAWIMGQDQGQPTPRAVMLGALKRGRGMQVDAIAGLCGAGPHAPPALTDDERQRLTADDLSAAPDHVKGDYPEWLAASFAAAFGDKAVAEGMALAERAPVDLRANTLKLGRDKALEGLSHLGAQPTALSPWGLRISVTADGRGPALAAEPAYVKGQVEVQDEASQLAALIAGAKPGWQVLDLCAGAGGKSLALAAMMDNKGQIFATDNDGRRLMPIYERLERSGARNVQVRAPKAGKMDLADLEGRCDLVFVDAPCTGTGTWRRSPDAKWRTRPGALQQRQKQQDEVLRQAASYVKTGGRLVYVTCSVLREENEERVTSFLESNASFLPLEAAHLARGAGNEALAQFASPHGPGLRLSPASAGTDGFYIAVMLKA